MSDTALYMAEIWRWTKMCQPWLDNTSGTFIIGIPCVKFYKSDGDRTLPRGPDRLVKSLSRYIHALVSFSQSTQTPYRFLGLHKLLPQLRVSCLSLTTPPQ